jgi:hypothetical protein
MWENANGWILFDCQQAWFRDRAGKLSRWAHFHKTALGFGREAPLTLLITTWESFFPASCFLLSLSGFAMEMILVPKALF